jgi:hypothetical protein
MYIINVSSLREELLCNYWVILYYHNYDIAYPTLMIDILIYRPYSHVLNVL